MDNRSPLLPPTSENVGQALPSIESLPPEVLSKISEYLAIKPDVTTKDQIVQRSRNLRSLSLVSRRLCSAAARSLYEVVHITKVAQLGLFFNTVEFQPELGQLVRKLSVNLRICWRDTTKAGRVKICDQLYRVLNATTRLRSLSLELEECTDCFRNSGPEDIAAGGPSDGYDSFYERVKARIWNELKLKPEHRTFLPSLEEFFFASNDIPYTHCAFFALPSLRHIVSMRDTGAWLMTLDSNYDIETRNPHIKKLSLRNSALTPSEAEVIFRFFPRLDEFEFSTNPQETNDQVFPGSLNEVESDRQSLSATLAEMSHLRSLVLGLHFPRAPPLAQIIFPMHSSLGPAGGINSLGGLHNLTYLQIEMHHLMRYRGEDSQPRPQPLPPSVLPPNLERLRLHTCLSCWDNRIGGLWQNSGLETLHSYAAESTLTFIKYLTAYVSAGPELPNLRDVRLNTQREWWSASRADYRFVMHCKEDEGQIWNAGCFEEFCEISRFEKRTPGIHFRAYKTEEYGCGQHQP